jgi:nitrogen fixation protein NifB
MQLQEARDANEDIIVQFRHCSQCRADAIGLIGDNQSGGNQ